MVPSSFQPPTTSRRSDPLRAAVFTTAAIRSTAISIYAYDHTNQRFACSGTKSVVILSDQTCIEKGPFAAIRGSHKATFSCPFDMSDATQNPMAVPVFAAPGDVIIFSEGMMHGAYPVTYNIIRRSVYFCYMPSINRDNLTHQRMSMYPDHVLERLADEADQLTAPGYI